MNSGIRDAHNLAWKLAAVVQEEIGPALLDSYEQERAPHAHALIQLLRILTGFGSGGRLPAALDQHPTCAQRDPAHLPRHLVPQGRGRKVPVAQLRREHASAQVDRGSVLRPRQSQGKGARLAATLPEYRLDGLDFLQAAYEDLRRVDGKAWRQEEFFLDRPTHLRKELLFERELFICRL